MVSGTNVTERPASSCWRGAPDHPPITQQAAEAYLAQDLVIALNATLRYCPVLAAEPENRLAAIVDFTFNLRAAADFNAAAAGQSARLAEC